MMAHLLHSDATGKGRAVLAFLLLLLALAFVSPRPADAAGTTERWSVGTGEEAIEVVARLPEGYRTDERLPFVLILHGTWHFNAEHGLERLLNEEMPRAVVVALPIPEGQTAADQGRALRGTIWPAIVARYPGVAEAPMRGVMAFSSGANDALSIALREPDMFDRVALQSPGWMAWDRRTWVIGSDVTDEAVAEAEAIAPGRYPDIWFIWGDADEEWERRSRENGARVIAALVGRGVRVTDGGTVPGGHDGRLLATTLKPALDWLLRPMDETTAG